MANTGASCGHVQLHRGRKHQLPVLAFDFSFADNARGGCNDGREGFNAQPAGAIAGLSRAEHKFHRETSVSRTFTAICSNIAKTLTMDRPDKKSDTEGPERHQGSRKEAESSRSRTTEYLEDDANSRSGGCGNSKMETDTGVLAVIMNQSILSPCPVAASLSGYVMDEKQRCGVNESIVVFTVRHLLRVECVALSVLPNVSAGEMHRPLHIIRGGIRSVRYKKIYVCRTNWYQTIATKLGGGKAHVSTSEVCFEPYPRLTNVLIYVIPRFRGRGYPCREIIKVRLGSGLILTAQIEEKASSGHSHRDDQPSRIPIELLSMLKSSNLTMSSLPSRGSPLDMSCACANGVSCLRYRCYQNNFCGLGISPELSVYQSTLLDPSLCFRAWDLRDPFVHVNPII
ncbi:uncharacterized protein CLUP02_08600 [Colletotrichum lupini]|uniref:Uncharacterized protein n=1 Tax=Colletotrichum lupini TaxID=145971 RepID=A0A9Q8WHM0_9PEZI|nr:uncharacterized protein CLUP02_08600 [Colletotrichum lupini]UQC83107.1 hypothetical protein CLUP02_08600 [Colletotrichum lupini]